MTMCSWRASPRFVVIGLVLMLWRRTMRGEGLDGPLSPRCSWKPRAWSRPGVQSLGS